MDGDGGGPTAAPAPMPGLGNFKGVMLCNRPNDGGAYSDSHPPFRSAIAATAGEQLGLPPAKRTEPKAEIKKCGPSAALRRHVQWIKELQEQVRQDQKRSTEAMEGEDARKQSMAVAFKKQRDAIRKVKAEGGTVDRSVVEAILKPKSKNAAGGSKPLWAMTEEERDDFDEEQASELLSFAEGLDFDAYIHDLEFRQCLQVVRDRARNLQKAQDSFKESIVREFDQAADGEEDAYSDVASSAGGPNGGATRRRQTGARGGGADDKPDWDASTACGDERANVDRNAQSAASHLLESNPKLRAVHSKGSMQKVLEKASVPASEA